MVKRRKKRSLQRDVGGFVGAGVGLGVGSAITAKVGYGSSGMAAMGGMMPVVGVGIMGKHAIRGLSGIRKASKKKRRR